MTTRPARLPFNRLSSSDPGSAQGATRAGDKTDLNFQAIQRFTQGVFVPKVITHALSPYQVQATDWLLLCDCSSGTITLTYLDAARVDGFFGMVIKTDASANAVTLSGTFNGVVNPTLSVRYQSKTINAGNGAYYFVPTLTAADILPGTFPGNYVISGTLEVDGNFSVNTTKFTVTASSGNFSAAGTGSITGMLTLGSSATGFTPIANTQLLINERVIEQVGPGNMIQHTYSVGGTMAAPTATPSGRFLWTLGTRGYDGSAYTGDQGRIAVITTQAWTSTARGTQIVLATTANGSTSLTTRLTIDQDGSATFANTLASTGDFSVNTSKFTVVASSGNTACAGTFTASGMIQATVTGESLRLRYDASNYVSFAVSSTGGLTITPQSGQAVNVTTFNASGKVALSAQTRVGDLFRVESVATPDTTGLAGAGVEITYDPTNFGIIKAYDYTGSALKHLKVDASGIQFTNAVSIDAGGFTATGSTVATISQVTTTTGVVNARWTNNTNYTVELGYTGAGSIAYLWGTTGTGLALGANGAAMLTLNSGGTVQIASATDLQFGRAVTSLGGGAGATLGTIGGSGPATAAQNSWQKVVLSDGSTGWTPVWK